MGSKANFLLPEEYFDILRGGLTNPGPVFTVDAIAASTLF